MRCDVTSCCRYNIVFFLVTYLLPMLGMVICYLQMGVNLWRTDSNIAMTASAHPALIKSRQNKKRVILYFKYKARFIPQYPSLTQVFLVSFYWMETWQYTEQKSLSATHFIDLCN